MVWSLDGPFWRTLARWGSSHGPEWFVRLSPPVLGVLACAIAAERREHVRGTLQRVRGDRGAVRDALDVARTFATYASCLSEALSAGSARGRMPEATIWGELHLQDALAGRRGLILVTAHTAGWETVGALLSRDHELRLMIVEQAEPDEAAREIQDNARRARGLQVAHVGATDPLAALPLARHLRQGGAVALQIDRVPRGLRARSVTLFGRQARIPEGPLRLAMLTQAPLVPVFCARTGYRRYGVVVHPPLWVGGAASDGELDAVAGKLAGALESFVRAHPTQWFHFQD